MESPAPRAFVFCRCAANALHGVDAGNAHEIPIHVGCCSAGCARELDHAAKRLNQADPRSGFGLNGLSGFIRVAIGCRLIGVIKYGHGRFHATESESTIEILLARNGVKDDLPVAPRRSDQALDDFASQASPLMRGVNGYVADVGAIDAVSNGTPSGNQHVVLPCKELEHAVRKSGFQPARRLVAERSEPIHVGELRPVDRVRRTVPPDHEESPGSLKPELSLAAKRRRLEWIVIPHHGWHAALTDCTTSSSTASCNQHGKSDLGKYSTNCPCSRATTNGGPCRACSCENAMPGQMPLGVQCSGPVPMTSPTRRPSPSQTVRPAPMRRHPATVDRDQSSQGCRQPRQCSSSERPADCERSR